MATTVVATGRPRSGWVQEAIAAPFFKVYALALLLVLIAEFTGTVRWTPVAKITILLVPFFHTIYWAVAFAPQLLGKRVPVYTDNFLDFDVGDAVPTGSYDRESGEWEPEENGRVISNITFKQI